MENVEKEKIVGKCSKKNFINFSKIMPLSSDFVTTEIVLCISGPLTTLSVVAGIALVVLGGNMALAAYSGTESWLSRLGPLP